MTMISEEEYEVLKGLEDNWKWIARDGECNSLNVFSVKPIKIHTQWDYIEVGYRHTGLTKEENKMFQFIQWEDEEPYRISELIREYESEVLDEGKHQVREDGDMEEVGEPCQEYHDPVHRPQHYMQGHIETVDKIKLLLTPEEYLGYLKGNVIKYDRAAL